MDHYEALRVIESEVIESLSELRNHIAHKNYRLAKRESQKLALLIDVLENTNRNLEAEGQSNLL